MNQIASIKLKGGGELVNGNMVKICEYDQNDSYCGDNFDEHMDRDLYEEALDVLAKAMEEINPDGKDWTCRVENFGWQRRNGVKNFKGDVPVTLIQQVLPNCECRWKVFRRNQHYKTKNFDTVVEEIVIQNWHHDNPSGSEHYYIAAVGGGKE